MSYPEPKFSPFGLLVLILAAVLGSWILILVLAIAASAAWRWIGA
jgi:hypothetical protein